MLIALHEGLEFVSFAQSARLPLSLVCRAACMLPPAPNQAGTVVLPRMLGGANIQDTWLGGSLAGTPSDEKSRRANFTCSPAGGQLLAPLVWKSSALPCQPQSIDSNPIRQIHHNWFSPALQIVSPEPDSTVPYRMYSTTAKETSRCLAFSTCLSRLSSAELSNDPHDGTNWSKSANSDTYTSQHPHTLPLSPCRATKNTDT